MIGLNGHVSSGVVATTSNSQQNWLSSADNDIFNFRSGLGAEIIPHASAMEIGELGLRTGTNSAPQAAHEAATAITEELGHWSVNDPGVIGAHESAHLVGLHAGNFIIS